MPGHAARRMGLALLLSVSAFTALVGGCSLQGEGERCDLQKNGDADCDDGLVCTSFGNYERCCPPEGNPIGDARCKETASTASGGSGGGGASNGGGGASSVAGGGANASGGGGLSGGGSSAGGNGGTAGEPTGGSDSAGSGASSGSDGAVSGAGGE